MYWERYEESLFDVFAGRDYRKSRVSRKLASHQGSHMNTSERSRPRLKPRFPRLLYLRRRRHCDDILQREDLIE
jgi:hypothetical protein